MWSIRCRIQPDAFRKPPFGESQHPQHPQQPQEFKDEELMDTHLMIGVAVMLGLIGIAASRDLLRRLREQQPQLMPIKVERPDLQVQRHDR
ncbi:hypothetical protein [Paraburkholderia sp.]|uniref:hypothetical protein n=1 Tax=Paraburkholderia sp. TaxID=1926495 RepID=UPI002AFF62D6|nr:hypothetical protein [Paraburkholderia sp.]